MKNRGKIVARKSGAKIMKIERKRTPNGSQNPLKVKKIGKKNEVRKKIGFWKPRRVPARGARGTLEPSKPT